MELDILPLLMLFKQFEHMCVVILWFIISISKNVLIFCANLFATISSCFKKHNLSQQKHGVIGTS
jgi:hypothetical protein